MYKYKVSVIVPVYGVENYIAKCLDSLVNQSLEKIEIIVVNDGSKDNSQQIIDKYVKKYPDKIKSYVKENGGQGSARNYGLQVSNGEYIGYVDGDDFVEKTMFEKMYNVAKKEKADIVITRDSKITETGIVTDNYFFDKIDDKKINSFFGNMGVCNKIYKTNLIKKNNINFKSNVWYEDVAFTTKVLINANKIEYCIEKPLYYYLERNGSTMNNSNVQKNLEILDAFDDILEYIKTNGKEEYFEIVEFLAIYHIYIFAVTRILRTNTDRKYKISTINIILDYMENNFPNFENNKYIKLLPRNRKIIYKLIKRKMYKLVEIIFAIKK